MRLLPLFFVSMFSIAYCEEALPPSVVKLLDVYQQQLNKVNQIADKAKIVAASDLIKRLEVEQLRVTKNGDLTSALLIKNKVEEIKLTLDGLGSDGDKKGVFNVQLLRKDTRDYNQALLKGKMPKSLPDVFVDGKWRPVVGKELILSGEMQVSSILLLSRSRGAGEDSWSNVEIVINGQKAVAFDKIEAEQIIWIQSMDGSRVSSIIINYVSKQNDPWIDSILVGK